MFLNFIIPFLYSLIFFLSVLGLCFYLIGQIKMTQKIEKRIFILERKLQMNEHLSNNFYKLGQIYLQKNFYKKAISLFRKSLVNWDSNDKIGLGSLYNTLGFTYFQLKEYDYSKYYYLQAINLLPDYTLALTNLGLIYETNKMFREASDIYNTVLKYDKNNKIALSQLALIKRKTKLHRDGRI